MIAAFYFTEVGTFRGQLYDETYANSSAMCRAGDVDRSECPQNGR